MTASATRRQVETPAEPLWARASWRTRINLSIILGFLAVVLLFGGASRADVIGQGVVRLAAILMIAACILQLDREGWRRVRVPALLLLALTAVIAVQLIPLPPDIWSSLPGRSPYLRALELAEIPAVSRPLSLTPDLTLNSLLAVLPPLAVILALGLLRPRWYPTLLAVLLVGIAVSALIGIIQISTGGPYFYQVTNRGSAVGVFANRNHEALLLALAFPLLAGWASFAGTRTRVAARTWIAGCAAMAVFPFLLVTGSRAGLLLGVIGSLFAGAILYGARRLKLRSYRWRIAPKWLIVAVPVVLGVLAVILFRYFGRDLAFQRMFGDEYGTVRAEFLPIFVRMAGDFFPTGTGFGAFDTVFRVYEPHWALDRTYLNHAHNDLAQLIIEGGAPAMAVLLGFAVWYLARCFRLWMRPLSDTLQLLGRVGSAMIAMILLASLVDYPVRTPLVSVVFAIACCWMAAPRAGRADDVRLPAPASSGIAAAPGR